MKKRNLAPYLIASIFLHVGVLVGLGLFARSTSTVIPVELLPVETVMLEEKPTPAQPKPALSQQTLPKTALEAKSKMSATKQARADTFDPVEPVAKEGKFEPEFKVDSLPSIGTEQQSQTSPLETKSTTSSGTETHLDVSDLAGPVPREGRFEPSLNVESLPTLGLLPTGQEGKEVVSEPILARPRIPPLRLSPAPVSQPDQSPPPLEVDMPKLLVEAQTGGSDTYSQTQKKIETPIGMNRTVVNRVSELPPIPTVQSPSLPELREMILAKTAGPQTEYLERSNAITPPQATSEPLRFPPPMAAEKPLPAVPSPVAPVGIPAALDLREMMAFPTPGSETGAAFLFVLDTSGSVKGDPLASIKRSAREFVGLMGANDRAGILTFNDSTQLIQPFTSEKKPLLTEINGIRTGGKLTVLFDALMQAADLIHKENHKSKFLILFSDGKDEGSTHPIQDVIRKIRDSGISVLCVGYSRVEKKYLDTLRIIAEGTGGIAADAPHFNEIVMLYKAARAKEKEAAAAPS